jgi:Xaa-Pro aminopeptidase
MDRSARLERLRQLLHEDGVDGAVIRRPANVAYLTGFPATPGHPRLAVVGPKAAALVAPGSAEAARAQTGPGVAVVGYAVPGATVDRVADVELLSGEALEQAIETAGLPGRRIGVEETQLSAYHAAVVARWGTVSAIGPRVEALRRIKDADELLLIRAAVAANDAGFEAAGQAIGPGTSEFRVQAAVVRAIEEAVDAPVHLLDDTNCLISGPRTAGAVGPPTSRRLETGDLMIVDINPFVRGYKADTTRTFSVGPPSAEHRRMYEVLARALEAAERVARPGVPANAVYAALADTITGAGYGAGLRGHGGHAIGLEHLERPYVIAGETMPLAEGMVLTLEPGIYLPDLGLRLEDNYLVTAGGLELLSHFSRELVACR